MHLFGHKEEFGGIIEFLKSDLATLRTGRASAAMLDMITVEAYGSRQPVKSVASISVSDAKTIVLEPWDKSLMAPVEKGVRDSGLGINPVNDGRVIRLILPELTSERRQELVKILHQKLEQARISVRKIREDVRALILAEEKAKTIGEDEKFRLQEELEKMVKDYNDEIKKIGENKEKEITTV